MRMLRLIRWTSLTTVLSFASVTLLPPDAAAQPAAAGKKPAKKKSLRETLTGEAKSAFERAVNLMQASPPNPDGALTEFQKAYDLSKDPRLLFNMAIAERDLKRYSRAVGLLDRELKEGADSLTDDEKKTAKDVLEGLKQYTAPLSITVNEPGATVLIDGREVGKSPLSEPVTVDVGERTVTIKKTDYLDATTKVSISGGSAAKVELKIEPAVKMGKLVVRGKGGTGTMVFVDGVEAGPAPWEGPAKEGKHTIELRSKGFVTESRTENVEYKGTTVIEVTMRPDQGKVRVETDKDASEIFVDGALMGKGTWEGTLPSGGHSLLVSRKGYEPFQSELTVQTDQARTVKVSLRSKGGTPWWVWAGAGVVLVGGGVATYFLTRPKTQDAPAGTIPPFEQTVGYRF